MTTFRTLVADPPWRFGDRLPGPKRGSGAHYSTLSVSEVQRFPLPELAPDGRLFLWRPESFQREAMDVISAWGFRQVASVVWIKTARSGRVRIGMGHQVRMAHETALIAVRGRPERLSASIPSVFFAPRGAHSAKPDEFYELVEQLSPGPYVELFARREREGWTTYGAEVGRPAPGWEA